VLLLDEPTFGVDPISRRELWLILQEMVAEGVAIVLTTSYLDEAERCDRVGILHEGRMLALDTPAALQARLAGSVLRVPGRDTELRNRLRGLPGVRRAVLFGDTIHVTIEDAGRDWRAILPVLERAGIDAAEVALIDPVLEDVFMDLVAPATGHD
jgi:ABC-2 type transport system ATP-binding protein